MKRNNGLDILKAICSFLIICIHTPFPGFLGKIFIPLTRIAVPIFFMITGYFYSYIKELRKEKIQIVKIFKLCLWSNFIYFLWGIIETCINGDSVILYIRNTCSLKYILKFLLFNDSPFGGHLWYLSAVLYVLIVLSIFEKRWCRRKLYVIVPILLLFDIIFGKYSLLLFGKSIPFVLVRNFLFVGIPYFLVGDFIKAYNVKIKTRKILLCCIIFSITTLIERVLLGYFNVNATRDHYISTTFLAVSVFLLFLQFENVNNGYVFDKLRYIGKELSVGVYVLHPIVIVLMDWWGKFTCQFIELEIIYMYLSPFIIFIFTTIISWIYYSRIRRNNIYLN